jgi:hypothetical protein
MKVFRNVEIEIGVKKTFSCQFAFTILVIPPPHTTWGCYHTHYSQGYTEYQQSPTALLVCYIS